MEYYTIIFWVRIVFSLMWIGFFTKKKNLQSRENISSRNKCVCGVSFLVLRIEPKALCLLDRHAITELHPCLEEYILPSPISFNLLILHVSFHTHRVKSRRDYWLLLWGRVCTLGIFILHEFLLRTFHFDNYPSNNDFYAWPMGADVLASKPLQVSGLPIGLVTGVPTHCVLAWPISWFDTRMSRVSVTHANSSGDDKPQTTCVPFLPAPRGLRSHHSERSSLLSTPSKSQKFLWVWLQNRVWESSR